MSTLNQNHMMYDSWDMECNRQNVFSFWIIFALLSHTPPPPPNNSKNQNLEKLKKIPRDIIILHKCTINDNHIIYGSWDINYNRQIFLSFLSFTSPPPNNPKNENTQKWKKCLEISSFYTSVPQIMIIGYIALLLP